MKQNQSSRRKFITSSALGAAGLLFVPRFASALAKPDKPNSMVGGVQIGVITYSFRSMPGTADDLLKYCLDCNISAIELMGDAAEAFAGAPKIATGEARPDFQKKLAEWRAGASMDKLEELRKKFYSAGIKIYAWKPSALGKGNTDEEIIYAFKGAKALGADHVTVELPDEAQTKRLGDLAAKHRMKVGYHAHAQATPTLWDAALAQSEYNGINLDLGHYVAGTTADPLEFIQKNHARITSMHVKDRKHNNGGNLPWGQGDTPIKEALAFIKKNKYKFPVTIEMEYAVPQGSDAVAEVKKCREYAADALKG